MLVCGRALFDVMLAGNLHHGRATKLTKLTSALASLSPMEVSLEMRLRSLLVSLLSSSCCNKSDAKTSNKQPGAKIPNKYWLQGPCTVQLYYTSLFHGIHCPLALIACVNEQWAQLFSFHKLNQGASSSWHDPITYQPGNKATVNVAIQWSNHACTVDAQTNRHEVEKQQ